MHYYQHHIGDFIRDTSRLTDQQSMAYLRLLWLYYESEQPLKNPQAVAFKIGVDQPLVELLLQAFFKPDGDAWRHTRCDAEIAAYHQICQRNRDNGVKGGRPKKTQSVSSGNPDAPQTEPMRNPTVTLSSIHDPLPIIQEREAPRKRDTPTPADKSKTLTAYLESCKANKTKPIPDGHSLRAWAAEAGITGDMLQIAWVQFRERYTEAEKGKGKRYKDWPAHFATAVKNNWFKLWFAGDHGMQWSSNGLTHKTVLDARMKKEADHA